MMNTSRRTLIAALAALPMLGAAKADSWPARTIKVVVPFPAGSGVDGVIRPLMETVSKSLGQAIVVENRPGAGGTIGTAQVAKADPDGYTFLAQSNSLTVSAATYKKLSYDSQQDLVGVAQLASPPTVLVVNSETGIHNFREFLAAMRKKGTGANYGSTGPGGATHLMVERMRIAAKLPATHVPFKGASEVLTELLAGRVDFTIIAYSLVAPFIKAGKLTALAVNSSQRSTVLPNVPTLLEAGLPESDYQVWLGLLAPAKTSKAVLLRMNEEIAKASRLPEIREKYAALGVDLVASSVDEFGTLLKKDFELNAALVKALNIEPN